MGNNVNNFKQIIVTNSEAILVAQAVTKSFAEGEREIAILAGVDLQIMPGEVVAIVGRSGSGKSTLLHILGGLDHPTAGQVRVADQDWRDCTELVRSELRNRYLGFVYQFHHLLPEFNAWENVAMPLWISRRYSPQSGDRNTDRERALEMLGAVGLAERSEHHIGWLSGGERQRVAIARALVTRPRCVLADEPTGNLDQRSAEEIYELITKLRQEFATAFVIVTHDQAIASKVGRVLLLENGLLTAVRDFR